MLTRNTLRWALIACSCLSPSFAAAQPAGFNYDEALVPQFELPSPLTFNDGTTLSDPADWPRRRDEILEIFRREMFGRNPDIQLPQRFEIVEQGEALNGKALRQQIAMIFGENDNTVAVHLLLYTPRQAQAPVPTFLGLNFHGNHTIHPDPAILITKAWVRDDQETGATNSQASEAGRGTSARRWPVEYLIDQGCGIATAYYGEIDPDFDDGFQNGIHRLTENHSQPRAADAWGSIATWAWGLSRSLDALETIPQVDAKRVIVVGHSRLGKTALWAGATDERFAMVVSNNSGCGGAALSKRRFGETVARITSVFPHWFADAFDRYADREQDLDFDQHLLIAAIAPRPVHIASASEDLWADPKGEFLSAAYADPIYRLLGTTGLPSDNMPGPSESIHGRLGYHLRPGPHDILIEDWREFVKHAQLNGLL